MVCGSTALPFSKPPQRRQVASTRNSRYQSATNNSILMLLRAQVWWGRWESNPHELPRPLLRRLRLPFRHFPAKLRPFRVEGALRLGGTPRGLDAELQLRGPSRERQCHEQGAAGPSHVEVRNVSRVPAKYR